MVPEMVLSKMILLLTCNKNILPVVKLQVDYIDLCSLNIPSLYDGMENKLNHKYVIF